MAPVHSDRPMDRHVTLAIRAMPLLEMSRVSLTSLPPIPPLLATPVCNFQGSPLKEHLSQRAHHETAFELTSRSCAYGQAPAVHAEDCPEG